MPPTAGLATSEEDHTIYSTYNSGANIIVANADGDTATLGNEMGYYDQSYQQLQEAPYAYFEKSGSGSVTFDTVLMPSNNDKSAAATATKLETVPNATALKIDYTLNNSDYDGYYYMSYDNQPGQFGKYETDGQVAFVQENQQGKAIYAMIKNGTYIKDANGKDLLRSNKALDEFSVDMSGSTVNVVTAEKTDVASVSVNTGRVSKVMLNGENVPFSENNGILSEIGDGDKTSGGDKVPSDGIDKNSKPGSGGPGGGDPIGPDPVGPDEPDGPDKPDSEKGFADVEGHWAAEYANDLKKKGIANGDSDGNFRPDAQITRAELLAMVVRGMGFKESKYQDSYEDVSAGDWYADVIQTALDTGLVSADARFRPNDNITRQEMAKILAQAAQISKKFEDIEIVFADFNDKAEIAGWAADYVDYVVSIGLMQGDGGNFKPLDNATRGEAAAVISRLLK